MRAVGCSTVLRHRSPRFDEVLHMSRSSLVSRGARAACVAAAAGTLAMLLWALVGFAQRKADQFDPVRVVPEFQPITRVTLRSVHEIGDELNPTELVLGVTIGEESRAYPINMLTGPQREIINDMLGGQAIAATW